MSCSITWSSRTSCIRLGDELAHAQPRRRGPNLLDQRPRVLPPQAVALLVDLQSRRRPPCPTARPSGSDSGGLFLAYSRAKYSEPRKKRSRSVEDELLAVEQQEVDAVLASSAWACRGPVPSAPPRRWRCRWPRRTCPADSPGPASDTAACRSGRTAGCGRCSADANERGCSPSAPREPSCGCRTRNRWNSTCPPSFWKCSASSFCWASMPGEPLGRGPIAQSCLSVLVRPGAVEGDVVQLQRRAGRGGVAVEPAIARRTPTPPPRTPPRQRQSPPAASVRPAGMRAGMRQVGIMVRCSLRSARGVRTRRSGS